MSGLGKKRISAKEAAEFLGVPYATVSRIDRRGEFIKRYKLGHKTYVYDLESLEAFLEAKLVKPIPSPVINQPRSRRSDVAIRLSGEPKESLRDFLRQQRVATDTRNSRAKAKSGGK
ncbi:helix-turn-helix domain-containing protein [Paraburkholderia sediminicola]|uniref:helix-turn-helix transcriptional regulator n=1 Tax=Paraburkholderia sediminicola TaxID=458836 RepID=UPI0038BB900A